MLSSLKKASEESRKSRGSEEKEILSTLVQIMFLKQLQTMIEGSKSSVKIMTDQWDLGLLAECKEQLLWSIA